MGLKLKFLLLVCLVPLCANARIQPFSQYGQIQNVQNYSSSPFWSPNSPYNQKFPQAVYVDGADMNAGDCQRTVSSLVTTECARRNNCIGAQLSDIRPSIMLQLSRLPGHNYATSCAGFIDAAFADYVQKYANAAPTGVVGFPAATAPNNSADNDFQIENPYADTRAEWKKEEDARKQELRNLQSINGAGGESVMRAAFPTTYADLSFEERVQNASVGYAPYKEVTVYKSLKVESEKDYNERRSTIGANNSQVLYAEYCKKNPNDPKCKNPTVASTTPTPGADVQAGVDADGATVFYL